MSQSFRSGLVVQEPDSVPLITLEVRRLDLASGEIRIKQIMNFIRAEVDTTVAEDVNRFPGSRRISVTQCGRKPGVS